MGCEHYTAINLDDLNVTLAAIRETLLSRLLSGEISVPDAGKLRVVYEA